MNYGYMILRVIVEGLGLGLILMLVCALGIRKGAVGMAHLYNDDVQKRAVELGLTTFPKIKRNGMVIKLICVPIYLIYVIVCVYVINGTRGFLAGFWQAFVILMIMNLIDRLVIDEYWVGHTKAWIIPGTEDLRPYITAQNKKQKWIMATVVWTVIAGILSGMISLFLK